VPGGFVVGGRLWPSGAHAKLEIRIVRTLAGATLLYRQ
jgi:hypothetical protein